MLALNYFYSVALWPYASRFASILRQRSPGLENQLSSPGSCSRHLLHHHRTDIAHPNADNWRVEALTMSTVVILSMCKYSIHMIDLRPKLMFATGVCLLKPLSFSAFGSFKVTLCC